MKDSKTEPARSRALLELYRHTVPILDYGAGQPVVVGTGVFIIVDAKHFITTAAHPFEVEERRVAFGALDKSTQRFEVFGDDRLKKFVAQNQDARGDMQSAVYKDGLDLAIIELDGQVLERTLANYRAFDLRQNSPAPPLISAFVSGWPARKNVYHSRKRLCEFDSCCHIQCPIVPTSELAKTGWDENVFFGLSADKKKDFIDENGRHLHLFKLEGMSGSGVWVPSQSSSGSAWSLAGIAVEDHPSKRMLKVIRIEHVWAPLSQGWGLFPNQTGEKLKAETLRDGITIDADLNEQDRFKDATGVRVEGDEIILDDSEGVDEFMQSPPQE